VPLAHLKRTTLQERMPDHRDSATVTLRRVALSESLGATSRASFVPGGAGKPALPGLEDGSFLAHSVMLAHTAGDSPRRWMITPAVTYPDTGNYPVENFYQRNHRERKYFAIRERRTK
jgi:hypothetical protein